jgi:hypothetical protein
MTPKRFRPATLLVAICALAACGDTPDPTALEVSGPSFGSAAHEQATPSPLADVTAPFGSFSFWPYTGTNYTGTPRDPVNVVFAGEADPRALRASLLFLDGDRTAYGMPPVFPFNCTWSDAIGEMQTAYADPSGWVGSTIQLQCGDYDPIRFHLRFFDGGGFTLGGAHFELLIPGTTSHQVLSYELAEQLVVVDFLRSGILDGTLPAFPTGSINDAPYFLEIPAAVYVGLPPELKAAIGDPPALPNGDYPRANDGETVVLNVANPATLKAGIARQERVVEWDQIIPKPFCLTGPLDYLEVTGPVTLRQQVHVTPSGNLVSQFKAVGHLELTPINPLTGERGEPYRAHVNEHHKGIHTDNVQLTSQLQIQALLKPGAGERMVSTLNVGPGSADFASLEVRCAQ